MVDTISYSVHMLPPAYSDRLHPWTCRHDPAFVVQAAVHIVRRRGRNHIEIDHCVCLACGAPMRCTVGGNVLVDLSEVMRQQARFIPMFRRAWDIQQRWIRIARRLFGPDGWNGRHERLARYIDPHLTMRIVVEPGDRLGSCFHDESYIRLEAPAAEPAPKRARRTKGVVTAEVSA